MRQDRLGARFVHDGLPSRCDVGERLVPTDAFEPRLTLPADALERMEHAIGVIDAIEIVIHLGAERAAREGMRRIAGKLLGGAVAAPPRSSCRCPDSRVRMRPAPAAARSSTSAPLYGLDGPSPPSLTRDELSPFAKATGDKRPGQERSVYPSDPGYLAYPWSRQSARP